MCTKQFIPGPLGNTFAIRTPDSPACWSDYFREPEPGELEALFKKMRIERENEPMPTIVSVEAFLYPTSQAA